MDTKAKDKLSETYSSSDFLDPNESVYLSLIQHQIQPFFPDFASAILGQSTDEGEHGRCAVVEMDHDSNNRPTLFRCSEELRQYLSESEQSPEPRSKVQPRRRLFVLEDLPRNYICTLGSRLRIPPSFFASHYDDPADPTFNNRNAFKRYAASQFHLRYSDSHRVEIDVPPGETPTKIVYNTNVSRYLHAYKPDGPLYDEMRSAHVLSFWSSLVGREGAWDAVLLVDPPLGSHAKCLPSNILVPIRRQLRDETSMPKRYLYPEMNTLTRLPEDVSTWEASHERPPFDSIFDDTLNNFESGQRLTGKLDDPRVAVEWPRKLIIGKMISFLRRRYLNVFHLSKSHGNPNQTLRINYLDDFSKGALSKWHADYFNFIIGSSAAFQEVLRELRENMLSIGMKENPGGGHSASDLAKVVDEVLDALATRYMQYVTIQEARVSGATAQSLSKITVLTMLFVPLSTFAGILSMSDEFLPGRSRAWLFWVVSIPFLLSLAFLYWRQQLFKAVRDSKRDWMQILEKRRNLRGGSYV